MSAANVPELGVNHEGHVMRLTLQRPDKGNALSQSVVAALTTALEDARRLMPRLLVIEGAGPQFCTGFDLSSLEAETDDSLLARIVRVELLLQLVSAAPFATLAIAQGRVTGAGADLFCACSLRWIAGDAKFSFPGSGFGLVLGTARLADTVGAPTARGWVMGGGQINGDEALATGLATQRIDAAGVTSGREFSSLLRNLSRLDDETYAAVYGAAGGARRPRGTAGDGEDMVRLVRSAARPGLKERIAAYRAASARDKTLAQANYVAGQSSSRLTNSHANYSDRHCGGGSPSTLA
jgi:enoyl-CoA hydratase